jgi:hypothetical protein
LLRNSRRVKDKIADFMACPLWIECRAEEFTCAIKTTSLVRLEYMFFMEVVLSFFLSACGSPL